MAKKKEEKEDVEVEVMPKASMSLLTEDFGREDLNKMRDKINEIIKAL